MADEEFDIDLAQKELRSWASELAQLNAIGVKVKFSWRADGEHSTVSVSGDTKGFDAYLRDLGFESRGGSYEMSVLDFDPQAFLSAFGLLGGGAKLFFAMSPQEISQWLRDYGDVFAIVRDNAKLFFKATGLDRKNPDIASSDYESLPGLSGQVRDFLIWALPQLPLDVQLEMVQSGMVVSNKIYPLVTEYGRKEGWRI